MAETGAGGGEKPARELDRTGVFFATSELPVTGKPANKRNSSDQLRQTVAAWRTEYTPVGKLTKEQHAQFFDQGWVIVHDAVPRNVLQEAIQCLEQRVDAIARRLHAAGKIADLCEGEGFHSRLIKLDEQFPNANVLLHKDGVLPPGIQDLWSHRDLIGMAQQLLGEESAIMGHPVWNIRCKTPDRLSQGQATVPWHQDNAYLSEECWDKLQVTAWVPLIDTNLRNGCMQVVNAGHVPGVTCNHACCVGGTWYTEVIPEEMEATLGCDMSADIVTCEVPFGSVLLLNNLIPHRSMPNCSEGIRWSLDLRWQRAGEPNGFHGLKDSILMKPAGRDWDGRVKWGEWAKQDRSKAQEQSLPQEMKELVQKVGQEEGRFDETPEVDTTIVGPWMQTWSLLHHNRHTAKLDEPEADAEGESGGKRRRTSWH
uniref:Uncharacterized protein n=1 Tax=Alexandrium monilatum TaxID=311494 RepID=A0A7S4VUJ7_9DINO